MPEKKAEKTFEEKLLAEIEHRILTGVNEPEAGNKFLEPVELYNLMAIRTSLLKPSPVPSQVDFSSLGES